MSEQVMKRTHGKCRCEVCVAHDDTAVCGACHVRWPCDAAVGRAALERIEALAVEGRGEPGSPPFGIDRLVTALKALRAIRDEARDALGERA